MNPPTQSEPQSKSFSLAQITISNPCRRAYWHTMEVTPGDDTRRFCVNCEKHVHDLDSLTLDQIQTLIRKHDGHLCVRFTRPKPHRSAAPSERLPLIDILSRSAAGILLASSIAFAGCASTPPPDPEPYKPSALSEYYNSLYPSAPKQFPTYEPMPYREAPRPEPARAPAPFESGEIVGLILK